MIRYTATSARREFFRLLDAVDRGETVIVERRGVRYEIVRSRPDSADSEPSETDALVVLDPSLMEGQWAWRTESDGSISYSPSTQAE